MANKFFCTLSVAVLLAVSGCGVLPFHKFRSAQVVSSAAVHVLSLTQRTQEALNPTAYYAVHVKAADHTSGTVSVKQQPLIFFSPSLGGSQLMSELSKARVAIPPVLVATGFPPGTSHAAAVKETSTLLNRFGLHWRVVYGFRNLFGTLVTGLPDTYVWRDGHVWHIPGLLPTAVEWSKALR